MRKWSRREDEVGQRWEMLGQCSLRRRQRHFFATGANLSHRPSSRFFFSSSFSLATSVSLSRRFCFRPECRRGRTDTEERNFQTERTMEAVEAARGTFRHSVAPTGCLSAALSLATLFSPPRSIVHQPDTSTGVYIRIGKNFERTRSTTTL